MLSSRCAQRETERSSGEGVTNAPGHWDAGLHCPPSPDGPRNKSPLAGASCPCQSHGSGLAARSPGSLQVPTFRASSTCIPPWVMGRAAAGWGSSPVHRYQSTK